MISDGKYHVSSLLGQVRCVTVSCGLSGTLLGQVRCVFVPCGLSPVAAEDYCLWQGEMFHLYQTKFHHLVWFFLGGG